MADLDGIGVLVTRPLNQSQELAARIQQAGGEVYILPALDIAAVPLNPGLKAILQRLEEFDMAIFISANAVSRALNFIHSRGRLPQHWRIAAVGKASAKALQSCGYHVHIMPTGQFNSEVLLENPELHQVTAKKILIFRGEGGREVLAETLKKRGAHVEYAEVYRRIRPQVDTGPVLKAWARGNIHIVIATSNEILRNLYDMVGTLGQQWLINTPLVVISERMTAVARELGFKNHPLVADNAYDDALVATIVKWRKETYDS